MIEIVEFLLPNLSQILYYIGTLITQAWHLLHGQINL